MSTENKLTLKRIFQKHPELAKRISKNDTSTINELVELSKLNKHWIEIHFEAIRLMAW